MSSGIVDIIIVGGGPAGMFASFYGGMRQASVKLIESMPQLGGQLAALYPEKYIYDVAGFPKVTAQELVNNLDEQMKHFSDIQICLEEKVLSVEKKDERLFEVTTDKGVHQSKAVIITGASERSSRADWNCLRPPNTRRKTCTTLSATLTASKAKKVLISGGGDSAVDWALMLEPIAEQVTLIHRRDKFRAHEHSVENLMNSKVNVVTPTEIKALHGEDTITQVTLADIKSGVETVIDVDAVIVNFGFVSSLGPIAEWGLEIDNGSIVVDSRMETSIPGIFAAGDITTYPGKLKLIAVGFGEAPTAINNAKVYIDPTAKLSPGHSSNMKR